MYAPSEQLEQVEKQVKAQFNGLITRFEWWHEEEFTTIVVEIGDIAWDLRVEERTFQIINSNIGEQYIIALQVVPIESVGEGDDLFNLTYYGSGHVFFLDYYAPERPSSNPFRTSIYYTTMIEALRRVYLGSPSELWGRLFRPIKEVLAKRQGVNSFCQDLAPDLRDFLLEHLDFIERMIQASGEQLEVLALVPQLAPLPQPSNGSEPKREGRRTKVTRKPQVMLQTAVAAA